VYLNGTILGMRRAEIDRKFDEIVDFSGVEQFLDTPVKRYSSGMMVRLAFAVAAHLEPEILIVDEVLAVGDAEFQHKCLKRMDTVSRDGRTILFVSHNMGAVTQLCERALWLDHGRLVNDGAASDVVAAYMSAGMSRSATWAPGAREQPKNTSIRPIEARLVDLTSGNPATLTNFDNPLEVEVRYEVMKASRSVGIAYRLTDMSGNIVYTSMDTDNLDWCGRLRDVGTYVSASRMAPYLKPGRYNLTLMAREGSHRIDTYENVLIFDVSPEGCKVFPNRNRKGAVLPLLEWRVERCADGEEAAVKRVVSE
jgi:lipopolysaccharide transport system ATP-binding protein